MKNTSKQYDEYYEDVEKSAPFMEEMRNGKKNRRDIALEFFEKFKTKKILDVGCGPGFDAVYFLRKGFEVYACDISKNVIGYARKQNPGPKYFLCDIGKKPAKTKFDGIYAFEIIEHVFDYDVFLRNLYKSLKDGGILVITTPNVLAPRNRIKLLLGKDEWFESKYDIHFFSPRTLKKSLEKNGFRVLEIKSKGKISFLGMNFGGSMAVAAKKE